MGVSVAYAVVHDDPPRVFVADDIAVLQRVLALEVVARTDPMALKEEERLELREALFEERWADSLSRWINLTDIAVDVYTHLPVYTDRHLPPDLLGAQLQFSRLFRD